MVHFHVDPDAWLAAGEFFPFAGHRAFLRREGRGRALLVVHGYPTSSYDFAPIWPALTARFEVFAPDMLGFGFSDKPRGHRYRIAEQADLVLAALSVGGVREFDVFCHDYGVTVVQELLARRREGALDGLRSVVFLNGGLFPETHRARPIQKLLASPLGPLLARFTNRRAFGRSFAAVFGPETPPSDAEVDALYAIASRDDGMVALAGLIAYMAERREQRERWVTALVESDVPMRFVNGVFDPVSGAHMLDRLLELRPGSDVVRLPVGHYPQLEDPEGVLAAFEAFHAGLTR